MKNHYRKVANIAVASVGTAVGFILGVSEAVKAATFSLEPAITFKVIDLNLNGQGDIVIPNNFDVVAKGTVAQAAAVSEFNLGNFSFDHNTTINSAVIEVMLHSVWVTDPHIGIGSINPGILGIFGYVGNGAANASDFEAGVFLSSVDVSSFPPLLSVNTSISFDVTPFVKQRASNGDSFAGFGIRALNLGAASIYGPSPPRLIVETTEVPEPTTILGSITAIGVAGLLKGKKFKPAKK
ncbi:PEP-CTERM sorting domain-containing protein [Microcoleus sp. MON1_C1]|uniref:PEP-CTERM sorting domain-containing protein n=1 Tax=Microcoleus sp. MON1_C1 TaxID=2818827 RepID=UPI002FD1FF7D